ncbi:MAG: aminodeoxychorismate/anthranilate synthase component II [Bacteroidales bacterium]|nr:aminodeoxychorismate/anthranilate synthase component II [Bacteroidales bacterium]MDZ4204144.1 aminodeoxychorismate/anthranilate synthase component II [Bacteroidales bacterium]
MKTVLLIDNFDSFTWNLVQILKQSGLCELRVVCNDQISVADCEPFSHILFSPGPGLPSDAGITKATIEYWAATKVMLGVCLGHQAMAEVFGARLTLLPHPAHGEKTIINLLNNDGIFKGLPNQLAVGRYHSWVIDPASLPDVLKVSAVDPAGNIMAINHHGFPSFGVQFHPESILTPEGRQMIHNWLNVCSCITRLC